jgi:predicted amidohydrolase
MSASKKLTLSAIQFTAVDGEKEETFRKVSDLLDIAGDRGSDLVVLPEVWTGLGYSGPDVYKETAEPVPGPATELLSEKARRYGMYVVGSLYEKGNRGYYNSAPLIDPAGEIVGSYRKTHLFDAPNRTDIQGGIKESDKIEAGADLPVFETAIGTLGLSVCSDLRFPEVYRVLGIKGAQIIVCASAFLSPRYDHWEFFLRARAAENQCFVVASGQYGVEPKSGIGFVGRSMVVDPWGVVLATAPDDECCISADIDLSFIETVRQRYPLMEQRRPELYGAITET